MTRMRREAEDAQIVVVNHHLFLADLALRTGGRRGGARERHAAVRRGRLRRGPPGRGRRDRLLRHRVSRARGSRRSLRDAERALAAANALEALKSGPVRLTLESAREAVASALRAPARASTSGSGDARRDARRRRRDPRRAGGARGARLAARGARGASPRSRGDRGAAAARRPSRERASRRPAEHPRASLRWSRTARSPDIVRWIDVRARSVSLGASPVDVGATLRTRLFDRVPTVVCTSATLATGDELSTSPRRASARRPKPGELVVAVAVRLRLPRRALPARRPARAGRSRASRTLRPTRIAELVRDDRRRRVRPVHVDARDAGAVDARSGAASACR